jgi:predicted metal-binding protein
MDALIKQALAAGFSHAGALNMESVVFMPEIREMCSADRCRMYNKCWTCPPACGSVEDAAAKAAEYTYGIIVQTTGEMEDEFDYETMQETEHVHRRNFTALTETLRSVYPDLLPMGAGGCRICEQCTYPDAPCRFPDKAVSSMEAYGLWVSKVCELSGIPYYYGKLTLTYTSCFLLK